MITMTDDNIKCLLIYREMLTVELWLVDCSCCIVIVIVYKIYNFMKIVVYTNVIVL